MAQARSFSNKPWRSIPEISERWSVWGLMDASIGAIFLADDQAAHLAAAETTLTKALSLAPIAPWPT